MTLCVQGCITRPIITTKTDCTTLVPKHWENGVPHAKLPPKREREPDMDVQKKLLFTLNILKDTGVFATEQTGNVDKANGRFRDSMHIIRGCIERDKQAVDKSKSKFMGIF